MNGPCFPRIDCVFLFVCIVCGSTMYCPCCDDLTCAYKTNRYQLCTLMVMVHLGTGSLCGTL
ncbi:hypothetical protein PR001_g26092 [Phytophthora rubi]|uniref:Uncharacterized protein n=1 Tax=Phytophthora rubi TaxID=129364 RepID=A0A6A3I154_9STRA|nr:hypothetical protein PR001_g26092 [Phytophthora rubi]